ncbi:hypothetical protein ISCGN_019862, partial [Ixodes scapularis]
DLGRPTGISAWPPPKRADDWDQRPARIQHKQYWHRLREPSRTRNRALSTKATRFLRVSIGREIPEDVRHMPVLLSSSCQLSHTKRGGPKKDAYWGQALPLPLLPQGIHTEESSLAPLNGLQG